MLKQSIWSFWSDCFSVVVMTLLSKRNKKKNGFLITEKEGTCRALLPSARGRRRSNSLCAPHWWRHWSCQRVRWGTGCIRSPLGTSPFRGTACAHRSVPGQRCFLGLIKNLRRRRIMIKKICTYYDNNTRIINKSDFTFTIFFLGTIFRKGRLTQQERRHLESRSLSLFFLSFSFGLRKVQQHEAN